MSRLRWTATLLARLVSEPADRRRSAARTARIRDRRARSIARFAIERVPWYREAAAARGLSAADFRGVDDLERLPVVEPSDVSARPEDFLPRGARRDDWIEIATSGSSGTPKTLYHDPASAVATLAAGLRERTVARRFLGGVTGFRTAILDVDGGVQSRMTAGLEGLLLRSRRLLPERRTFPGQAPPAEVARRLAEFAPDLLHGYGSTVGRLFRHVHETGDRLHLPKVVTYTSDDLAPEERRLIEEEFGVPVLGLYRTGEAFLLGFECGEGRGMHVNADLFHVRIADADGRTVPDGETGSVILSNLVNRGTVLLNCRLGDRAVAVPGPCPCGRPLPRVELRVGRDYEWIRLPSGTAVNPFELTRAFRPGEVWRWQVVQSDPGGVVVRAVPMDGLDRAAWEERVTARFREVLGPGMRVGVELVDAIEPSASGKIHALTNE